MDELWRAVYDKAAVYFRNYCRSFPKTGKKPFFNLGMAYISFAREESRLFELLFVSERPVLYRFITLHSLSYPKFCHFVNSSFHKNPLIHKKLSRKIA